LSAAARFPPTREVLNYLSQYRRPFANFDDAWKAARKKHPAGHEAPDNVRLHLSLSKNLRPSDHPALRCLSRMPHPLEILDYGGNAGNLYYSYSPHLRIGRWDVYDLPQVMQAGKQIAAERQTHNLHFIDSVQSFADENVLLVSGAFHYWEKGIAEFLAQFSPAPRHILINRTPVHGQAASFITVQSTATFAVACRVWNRAELITGFQQSGYVLADSWAAPELSLILPLFPHLSVREYSGFYFERS
jgi:putative methyltransferase (TIGR04325 family)